MILHNTCSHHITEASTTKPRVSDSEELSQAYASGDVFVMPSSSCFFNKVHVCFVPSSSSLELSVYHPPCLILQLEYLQNPYAPEKFYLHVFMYCSKFLQGHKHVSCRNSSHTFAEGEGELTSCVDDGDRNSPSIGSDWFG
jgi:hypothetical protein